MQHSQHDPGINQRMTLARRSLSPGVPYSWRIRTQRFGGSRLRCVLLQSTTDNYGTAADARRLFGPDSCSRRLQAIQARNHSFSNARDALYEVMKQSFLWVTSRGANRRQVEP